MRKSIVTGITRIMNIPVTEEELRRFESGKMVQEVWPHLSDDQREFILNGVIEKDYEIDANWQQGYPHRITLFNNGTSTCRRIDGEPHEALNNKLWIQAYFEWVESKGFDPTAIIFETYTNGRWLNLTPYKTENGEYNWLVTEQS